MSDILVCLCCKTTVGVEMESSRTAYHYEGVRGGPNDPNRPIPLCRDCAQEHHYHWDGLWAEYQSGLL